jgi:hypothetical protein
VRRGSRRSPQADEAEQIVGAGRLASHRPAGKLHREPDVRVGASPGQEPRLLEDEANPGIGAVDRIAVERDGSAIGRQQAGNDPEERALAAAVRTDQRDDLARRHLEVDPVEGTDGVRRTPERQADIGNPDPGADVREVTRTGDQWRDSFRSRRHPVIHRLLPMLRGGRPRRDTSRAGTRRRRLLPSGLYRRLRSSGAGAPPSDLLTPAWPIARRAARGLVPQDRGTLPPVGNLTLPRRLCRIYHFMSSEPGGASAGTLASPTASAANVGRSSG